MKTTGIICTFIFTLMQGNVFAYQAWEEIQAKLDKAYRISHDQSITEFLRTYKDGTYEILRYTKVPYKPDLVERNLGRYVATDSKITFDRPEIEGFQSDFIYGTYFIDGDLYAKRLDLLRGVRHAKYHKTKEKIFFRPFYFSLGALKLVGNKDVQDHIDFPSLINYLIKDKKTQREKAMELMQFIVESVQYDYDGLRSGTYWKKPINLKSILASEDRTTVCAGYAWVLKELSSQAGISCEVVSGETKYSHNDINTFSGSHAWNLLELDGKKILVDVTWADYNDYMDMKWIDVQPSVMIGTHFPNLPNQQLLAKTLSKDEFVALPIMIPLSAHAKLVETPLLGKMYAKNQLKIGFKGRHTLSAECLPKAFTKRVYASELRDASEDFTRKSIGKVVYVKDSTYLVFNVTDQVSALTIKVDNQLEIKTIVCKGTQEDLLKAYLQDATTKQAVAFVMGLVASIKLNDMAALKLLVGDKHPVFFDAKGKFILTKQALDEFNAWNDEIPDLNVVHTAKDFLNSGNDKSEITSRYMDINNMRIELNYENNVYSIKEINVFRRLVN